VCRDEVLYELQAITPRLYAVMGNCDRGDDAWGLESVVRATVAGVRFLVVHDVHDLAVVPDDVDVVVHGHTHLPDVTRTDDVLYVNPGSASQRRSMPSRSVAIMNIGADGSVKPELIELDSIEPPTTTR
jgi:putative phosphoesterase